MAGFLGMRGTGSWATNQRPESWREMILYLYPNGSAPLTAMLSKMGSESVDDPKYHWWTKKLPSQSAATVDSGIYQEVGLTNALTATNTAAGVTVFAKVSAADSNQFRVGHQVLLRDASDLDVDVNGKVTAVNTTTGAISVLLLEADDNSTGSLVGCDTVLIIGNINEEGATMPSAISYDPVEFSNVTQIFRTPLEITRTARKTRLRTGDAYKELKREALEIHSIEIEKAFIWGFKTDAVPSGGTHPARSTEGLLNFIKANAASNIYDYKTDTGYTGKTWLSGGEDFIDEKLEEIFRFGSTEKLAFCGSGALLGVQRLAKTYGNIQLKSSSTSYGIKVVDWITPFGTLSLKTHPLFSYEATNRNMMVVLEPSKLKYKYVDDTFFKKDAAQNSSTTRIDGTKEEFLTECGLEYHHPDAFGILKNVGLDA